MRYDDDAGLVNAVLDGDKDAFVFLVDRYQGAVYAYCLNQASSEEDAKDITQEVLLKAYLNLGQLKRPYAFRSWLYTIASNECRMWYRKHQSHEPLASAAETATTAPSMYSDPETQFTVKKEIDALPESQRLVVLMHYFSGFTLKEIGEFLGVSREAIKVRLFRARQQLGLRLKSTFGEYFDSSAQHNFCVAILGKIASLSIPSAPSSTAPKAHRFAPLPLAAALSVMLLGGLAGLFQTGTDGGASQDAIVVLLLSADAVIEVAQADTPKKRVGVPTKRVELGGQEGNGDKISMASVQVIGNGRIDDIATSPDGKRFAVLTPFGLELYHPDGNQPPITVDTAENIRSPIFSRDSRFLVWHGTKQIKVWDIEKQALVGAHSFEMKFLFHIGSDFETDLDNRAISDDLRDVFAKHGLRLSNSIRFSNSLPDLVDWTFFDRDTLRSCRIRKEGDKLSVYSSPGTGWNFILYTALHPEMKEVAVALPLDEIMFVDPISGDWLRSFEWDTQGPAVDGMKYSPDGKQLMIFKSGAKYGKNPDQFFFLNPQDGNILHTFDIQHYSPPVTAYAYSPDGQWFAFRVWEENRIDVVDTTDWEVRKTFEVRGGSMSVASIAFSPHGRYLALGDTVWEFQTGEPIRVGERWKISPISRFLNDTNLLIKEGSSVKMLDLKAKSLSQAATIRSGISLGWYVKFLQDDDTILSADVSLSLFKASTGGIIESDIFLKDFYPRISAVSPVSDHVAVPNTDNNEIRIWDASERKVTHRVPFDRNHPHALSFSPDGKQLAVGEHAYTASLWDVLTATEVHRLVNQEESVLRRLFERIGRDSAMVRALAFSPDGKHLACGGKFDAIRIWDVKTGKLSQKFVIPTDFPLLDVRAQLKQDGRQDPPNLPMFLQFSKDVKRLFVGLASGNFVVFNIASGIVDKTLRPGYLPKTPEFVYPISVALNPDASLLAAGRTDHVIELIETQTWRSIAELKEHRDQISSLDFSHDGTKLLSNSRDGTMRIWELDGVAEF